MGGILWGFGWEVLDNRRTECVNGKIYSLNEFIVVDGPGGCGRRSGIEGDLSSVSSTEAAWLLSGGSYLCL